MSEQLSVTLRLRMGTHDAHYGGNLVDGARMLQEIRTCLENGTLEAMARNARAQGKPGAAARAAGLLEEFART